MNFSLLSKLPALFALVTSIEALGKGAAAVEGDVALMAEIAKSPALTAQLKVVSAEWRAIENDAAGVEKDKNILSKLKAAASLLKDAGLLEKSVSSDEANSALMAEINSSAVLKGHMGVLLQEWNAFAAELKAVQ